MEQVTQIFYILLIAYTYMQFVHCFSNKAHISYWFVYVISDDKSGYTVPEISSA